MLKPDRSDVKPESCPSSQSGFLFADFLEEFPYGVGFRGLGRIEIPGLEQDA